jgi:hypothetical protein
MKKNIAIAALSVSLIIICAVLFKECSKECPNVPEHSTSDTITVHDTIHTTNTVYYPKYDTIIFHDRDTIFDTSEAIRDYFAEKRYKRLFFDSTYKLNINIDIEQNALKTLTYDIDVYQMQTIITNTIVKKEIFSFALGCGFGYRLGTKMPIAELGLQFSFKDNIFGADYELFDKGVMLNYKYKIAKIIR